MHRTLVALAAIVVAAPVSAQMKGMGSDPTKTVKGSGELPSGWMMRFDPPRHAGTPVPPPTAVSVRRKAGGYDFKSGPAAIYYQTKAPATGNYSVSATFSQARDMKHEGYGLVIGGEHLQDSTQNYLYFLIRPMDGSVLINHRNGDDPKKIVKLVTWTPNAAAHKAKPPTGAATNHLEIRVAGDSVRFRVNGAQVKALSRADLQSQGVILDGLAGVRVNHNLDLQVSGFRITHGK